jgi:hypothetical protein
MRQRSRKFFGTIVLVAFISVYALTAMTIAAAKLPGSHGLVQLLFYIVAGLVWVVPAAILVRWMQRPDATDA